MRLVCGVLTALGALSVAAAEWCTMELPEKIVAGVQFEVKVKLAPDVPAGKLGVDLHWFKREAGAFGGTLGWAPRKDAKGGDTVSFKYTVGTIKPEMLRASAFAYMSPDGKYENRTLSKASAGIALGEAKAPPPDPLVAFKKSYLWIESPKQTVREGDEVEVRVKYHLEADPALGESPQIKLFPLGPWIDNPDGTINKTRMHVGYSGMGSKSQKIAAGDGEAVFKFKLAKTYRFNDMFFMAKFVTGSGKEFPWDTRGGGLQIEAVEKGFSLRTKALGGLFRYGVVPEVELTVDGQVKAQKGTLRVLDISGKVVLEQPIEAKSQTVKLPALKARGGFAAEAVFGDVSRFCYFAVVPDLSGLAQIRTPFYATDLRSPEVSQIAKMLGFSGVRHFTTWSSLQPARNVWQLDRLDAIIDANLKAGVRPWICLYGPPVWATDAGVYRVGFEPFHVDEKIWTETVTLLAKRYKGKIWGFEWLNEIVPGNKTQRPVEDYLKLCEVGTKAVKAVDPSLRIQLAGGLWPHNFRVDLLNAGVGEWIDILPVHYSSYSGIKEAQADLDTRGLKKVSVADNESARGMSVWGMTPDQALPLSLEQCKWVMTQWPAVLAAGAEFVTYFGGEAQSAGNWSYLLDEYSPRPVAATLAVVQGKLAQAKPLGKFNTDGGLFYLFEAPGQKAILFASAEKDGTKVDLRCSTKGCVVTDFQGNEMAAKLPLTLNTMPVIIEGLPLDALKTYVVFAPESRQVVSLEKPQVMIPSVLFNPYAKPLSVKVNGVAFALKAGETRRVEIACQPKKAAEQTVELSVEVAGFASFTESVKLYLIAPESVGNLLKPDAWKGHAKKVPAPEIHGDAWLFEGGTGWQNMTQNVKVPAPGQAYLYTAWVRSEKIDSGSNLGLGKKDGTSKTFFMPHVFSAGNGTQYWRLLTHRRETPTDAEAISCTPVAKGAGSARFANVSLSQYEGTEYAGFAPKCTKAPKIDGTLDDWTRAEPVPLLCDNQITVNDAGYKWVPENFSGIAYFQWDEKNLYLAAEVNDDTHRADTSSEDAPKSDSLIFAMQPQVGGAPEKAFKLYISASSPGGGSGKHTLYRPATYSGGMKSGHLAKDSSQCELAIRRLGTVTIYEVRIPWSELGGFNPAFGAKFGCSLQLNDADAKPLAAQMNWGGGLKPIWSPADFGIVTLLK